MKSPDRIPLIELFSSIQGEGAFAGQPQVFLRLAGCPLRCNWCDTPESWPISVPGGGLRRTLASAEEVARQVESLDPGGNRPLSVTGGEPLMWPGFLLDLRSALPDRRLHLETSGAFPGSLQRVRDSFDHLSVDLKLPSDLAPPIPLGEGFEAPPRGEGAWGEARRAVLPLLEGRDACLKLVVAGGHSSERFDPLFADCSDFAPTTPLFLQPVTPTRGISAPDASAVETLVASAESRGLVVRVVPQLHPLLGLR
jgi:7-carboxy-7-deazaguanine synthase